MIAELQPSGYSSRPVGPRRARAIVLAAAGLALAALAAILIRPAPTRAERVEVDTALIVSVDVSSSVDERRYKLQLEGIASALEDKGVIDAILNGPKGAILLAMVAWDDRQRVALPWVRIASAADAYEAARRVRALPRYSGQFTCVAGMLRYISDKVIPQIPARALRVVVDVSGDGSDNCNAEESAAAVRDELASRATTINGLPILEGREAATLQQWYTENVKGGPGSFILPADGYEDFGRAIRQKFVIEISGAVPSAAPPRRLAGY